MGEDIARRERSAGFGQLLQRSGATHPEICLAEMADEDLHLRLAPSPGDPPTGALTSGEPELVAGSSQGLPVDAYPFLGQSGEDLSRLHGHLHENDK